MVEPPPSFHCMRPGDGGMLIVLVMGANAAGELLPLLQLLGDYLLYNVFTWCLNIVES